MVYLCIKLSYKYFSMLQNLCQVLDSAFCGPLESNSGNIVDLINDAYYVSTVFHFIHTDK